MGAYFLRNWVAIFPTGRPNTDLCGRGDKPNETRDVIIQENHTFDNYFSTYPDANGINTSLAFPSSPNSSGFIKPHHLSDAVPPLDLNHERRTALGAFDNGKMDGFVYAEKSNLTLGYFDYRKLPYYWDYA